MSIYSLLHKDLNMGYTYLASDLGWGKDTARVVAWLGSPAVKPIWMEFWCDFFRKFDRKKKLTTKLVVPSSVAEIKSRSTKYLEEYPDKRLWNEYDHYRRFIVRMVVVNRATGGVWSDVGDDDLERLCCLAMKVHLTILNGRHPNRSGQVYEAVHKGSPSDRPPLVTAQTSKYLPWFDAHPELLGPRRESFASPKTAYSIC